MTTLILVEHDNQTLNQNTRAVLTAAQSYQDDICLLIAGENCQAVADQAACLPGVTAVWLADSPCYAHASPEHLSALLAKNSDVVNRILAPASTFGKNVLPRIAATLDIPQVSDVTHVEAEDTVIHPVYAGNAIETVKLLSKRFCLTIRTTAFEAAAGDQDAVSIQTLEAAEADLASTFVSHSIPESTRPNLNSAKVVVGGGRGFQDAERYKLLETFADKLGAAVAASRAAVDAGFAPNENQVGQTGKIIAPDLYIAVGISGAVQHLAGIKDAKVIVAINKDEEAPIFQVANYGLVGDLFKILPEMMEALD